MPTQVRGALERALHALREFTVAQRTLALIGLAVLVVGGIAVGAWLTRPQYVPLYSGLAGADASAIVEQLEANDVTYELTDGGTTIMVPQQDVAAQRIAAAAAGIPGSESGGYALLDTMGVTASEFQQNVTYKRALEGELAKTLQGLNGVTAASVQLALPEESVFVEEQAPATAAVFLETASGRTLSADQIMSVQHLVSSSVPGLAVEDVSVVDADGTLLSATTAGSADQAASDYETGVRDRIQTMLDQIVGVGNATVAVSAQVDAASAQQTSETFSAPETEEGEDPLVLQESTTAEIYGSGANAAGGQTGVLGPDNIAVPNDAAADGEATDDGYSNTTADRVNAINKVTEVRTIPSGTLVKQSVSIAIDEAAAEGISTSKIEELVAAAAGIDTERGDAVAVQVVAFAAAANAETAGAALDAAKQAESQAADGRPHPDRHHRRLDRAGARDRHRRARPRPQAPRSRLRRHGPGHGVPGRRSTARRPRRPAGRRRVHHSSAGHRDRRRLRAHARARHRTLAGPRGRRLARAHRPGPHGRVPPSPDG